MFIRKQLSDGDIIRACFWYFLGCLWLGLFGAKGVNIRDNCIRGSVSRSACIESTDIRGTCIGGADVRGTCIKDVCIRVTFVGVAYITNTCVSSICIGDACTGDILIKGVCWVEDIYFGAAYCTNNFCFQSWIAFKTLSYICSTCLMQFMFQSLRSSSYFVKTSFFNIFT